MENAWNSAKERIEKHAADSGVFVRLANNGDSVVGVFCGTPFAREVIWMGDKYEFYDPESPAHQATGKRPSMKVAINFYVLPQGEMKIIEGSSQWFRDLWAVREKYGLENWSFEIKRHGEPKDPKTKYTILPEEKLAAEQRERIAKLELHDIETTLLNGGSAKEDGDALVDESLAGAIIERMREIPVKDIRSMLEQFGAQRVRDLKASAAAAFLELLSQYESGRGDEVDPLG
jgi:hypothetical protein